MGLPQRLSVQVALRRQMQNDGKPMVLCSVGPSIAGQMVMMC